MFGFGLNAFASGNAKAVAANVPGNNGTLKIHEQGTPSGTENNDPKVCVFNVESFGLDAGQTGFLSFSVQGGDGPTGVSAGPFAFGPASASGYFATQYFNLQPGHYKATLYGKQLPGGKLTDVKAKSKVFKVTCEQETTPPVTTTTTTPPPTTTTTTPPVTTTTTPPVTTTTTPPVTTTTTPPVTTTTTPPVTTTTTPPVTTTTTPPVTTTTTPPVTTTTTPPTVVHPLPASGQAGQADTSGQLVAGMVGLGLALVAIAMGFVFYRRQNHGA